MTCNPVAGGLEFRVGQCSPGGGDDGGDDQVDGDDVDHTLGHAGELAQQATGVGQDDRLGHAEAADPPRSWLGQGGLDDGRSDDRQPRGALAAPGDGPGDGDLAERLGERVRVGPPDRRGTGAAALDHPVVHPVLAQPFGSLGQDRSAGRTELGAGGGGELRQPFRFAALGVGVGPGTTRCRDLGPPVERRHDRVRVDGLLGGGTSPVARDVAGADADQVRRHVELLEQLRDAHRAQQVHLDRSVERRVERDGGRGVDHHVAARQRRHARRRRVPARRCRRRRERPGCVRHELAKPSSPSSALRRSKQSLRRISRSTRRWAELRRPSRTNSTSSTSGTHRSSRSISAVPTKPVDPVTKIRWPASAAMLTSCAPCCGASVVGGVPARARPARRSARGR